MRAETIVVLVITAMLTIPFLVKIPASAFQPAHVPAVHTPHR